MLPYGATGLQWVNNNLIDLWMNMASVQRKIVSSSCLLNEKVEFEFIKGSIGLTNGFVSNMWQAII